MSSLKYSFIETALKLNDLLTKAFYSRDTAEAALELLGKKLFRRLEGKLLGGIIVETEAYYGEDDPASRAYNGKKNYNKVMFEDTGQSFIYNVHRYWMLNIVAHRKGAVGGILVRAIEPIQGIEKMKENRPVKDLSNLTSGPGKLTQALAIDKRLNNIPVTHIESSIFLTESSIKPEINTSHRIGVRKDLEHELRFYVKGNKFISRK